MTDLRAWNLNEFITYLGGDSESVRGPESTGESGGPFEVIIGYTLMFFGLIVLVWGSALFIKKLMSLYETGSWLKSIMLIIVGGAFTTGGFSMMSPAIDNEGSDSKGKDPPSSTQSPDSGSTPSPSPTKETSDPISMPEIENASTIFIVLGIIIAAAIIFFLAYLIIKRIRRDSINAKKERKRLDELNKRLDERWKTVTDLHSDLRSKVLKAETDWDMLFSYPTLTDVSVKETAAMYEAMSAAGLADDTRPADLGENTVISELAYPRLVTKFETAYKRAEAKAKRTGQRKIPAEERKKIQQIRDLLDKAENSGATENERTMAYNRAHKMISQLQHISVPTRAVAKIEDGKRLMLEQAQSIAVD